MCRMCVCACVWSHQQSFCRVRHTLIPLNVGLTQEGGDATLWWQNNKDSHYSGILIHTEDLTYPDNLKRWPFGTSDFIGIFTTSTFHHWNDITNDDTPVSRFAPYLCMSVTQHVTKILPVSTSSLYALTHTHLILLRWLFYFVGFLHQGCIILSFTLSVISVNVWHD